MPDEFVAAARALHLADAFLKSFCSSQPKLMLRAKRKIETHRDDFLQQAQIVYQREIQMQNHAIQRAFIPSMPLAPVTSSRRSATSSANFPVNKVEGFRNLAFHGRQALLRDIHDFLVAPAEPPFTGPVCFALHGLGGMGKTATALEYTFIDQESYDAIFWLRAQSNVELAESYCGIARKLKLDLQNEKQTYVIEEVKDWLEGTSECIFDWYPQG